MSTSTNPHKFSSLVSLRVLCDIRLLSQSRYHQLVQLLEFLLESVSTPLEAQISQTFSSVRFVFDVSSCCRNKSRLCPLSLAMSIVLMNAIVSLLISGAFSSSADFITTFVLVIGSSSLTVFLSSRDDSLTPLYQLKCCASDFL